MSAVKNVVAERCRVRVRVEGRRDYRVACMYAKCVYSVCMLHVWEAANVGIVYEVESGERQIISYRVCAGVCLAGAKGSRAKKKKTKKKEETRKKRRKNNK